MVRERESLTTCVCRYKILLKVGVGENVTVVSNGLTAVLLFNPWNSGWWFASLKPTVSPTPLSLQRTSAITQKLGSCLSMCSTQRVGFGSAVLKATMAGRGSLHSSLLKLCKWLSAYWTVCQCRTELTQSQYGHPCPVSLHHSLPALSAGVATSLCDGQHSGRQRGSGGQLVG